MSEPIRAKRGDLAVIVTTRRDWVTGQGSRESTTVELCEVTSITRDGLTKAVRPAQWDTVRELRHWGYPYRIYIVPKTEIDVAAALKAAAEHPWPSGYLGMPYDSLEEVKEVLRPLRRAV